MKKYLCITIFFCFACAGVVYAGWTNQTSMNASINTGCLSMGLSNQKEDYKLEVVEQNAKEKIDLDMVATDANGTVNFQIADKEPLDMVELLSNCQSICFRYPLLANGENTVSLISLANTKDQVVLKCIEAKLVCGDETQELSEAERNRFAPDIVLDDKKTLVKDETGMRIEQEMTIQADSMAQLLVAMQLTVAPDRFTDAENKEVQLVTKYQFEDALNLQQQEGENHE